MKKRYIIRLHKIIRKAVEEKARKEGLLLGTYLSSIIEETCASIKNIANYRMHPDSELFRLKRGNALSGEIQNNASEQISIYLSDSAYIAVGEIYNYLKQTLDKKITISYIIQDMIYKKITQKKEG